MKSIVAVLGGYLIFGLSSILLFLITGIDPKQAPELSFRIWSTLTGVFFALLSGYTAACIAGTKEFQQSAAVAILLALIATVSLIAQPMEASKWSQFAALGFMVPAVMLGGAFRFRQVRNKG